MKIQLVTHREERQFLSENRTIHTACGRNVCLLWKLYRARTPHMCTQRGYFSAKSGLKRLSYYSNIHLKERN